MGTFVEKYEVRRISDEKRLTPMLFDSLLHAEDWAVSNLYLPSDVMYTMVFVKE